MQKINAETDGRADDFFNMMGWRKKNKCQGATTTAKTRRVSLFFKCNRVWDLNDVYHGF